MNTLYDTFDNTIKMSLFSKIKTNNVVIDTLLSTILLTLMSYIVKSSCDYNIQSLFSLLDINWKNKIKYYLCKKNTISLSGKKFSSMGYFTCTPIVSSIFGNRFKAVWQEINNNICKNTSIYEIKDFLTLTSNNEDSYGENTNNDSTNDGVYIVSQKREFVFNETLKIYAITNISKEDSDGEKEKKNNAKVDNIDITLYSYHTSLEEIKKYVDELANKYVENIELARNGKRFIYTLIKTKYEDSKFECWKETIFDTTRSFDNMFFEGKTDTIKKIQFFLNNKEWYYNKGIPYTLGIGLHGPPGTGKTSFIKSLAIMTNRHIKSISFKLLKTRKHLLDFFFENRYCQNNKKNSIGFPQKIIVIEDIDAQGDIVLDRSKKNNRCSILNANDSPTNNLKQINVVDVVQTLLINEKERDKERDRGRNADPMAISSVLRPIEDDLITLDDILNLWDGLEENSGRILIISSNHYKDLDPALTRPGRIDITIEMNNASHEIIEEIYKHLYETTKIDKKMLAKIKPYFYSPAEIINLYLLYKDEPNRFMERLSTNKKI